jgi:hypothetical protein
MFPPSVHCKDCRLCPISAQKYTMENQALTCVICWQTCGCNELRRASVEGQLSAPAVWSERAFGSRFQVP